MEKPPVRSGLLTSAAKVNVFPNLSNGKHLSQAGMSSVLKRWNKSSEWHDKQGRNISAQGFRSTFRDYIAGKTTFDGVMAEHALAHKIPDATLAAYQRSTLEEKRRVMMQVYSDYVCRTEAAKGNLTKISVYLTRRSMERLVLLSIIV
jgi:integrase|tara:strand:+ start:6810 stop:7253 length:444 start_codon:yes stop_codon:yes gene_type:complete